MTNLRKLTEETHKARHDLAVAKAEYDAIMQGLKNSEVAKALDYAQSKLSVVEDELRAAIVAEYKATGNKKPAPGLGIRETSKLVYDADTALTWAKQHDMALALDKRSFEKIAKASPPEFVSVEVTPSATIATDLSEYVEE